MRLLARIAIAIFKILQEKGRFNPLLMAVIISFTLSSTSFSYTVDDNQPEEGHITPDEIITQKTEFPEGERSLPSSIIEDMDDDMDNGDGELINELLKLKDKLVISKKNLDYFQFFSYFENNLHRAEGVVINCIKSSKVRHTNRKKCRAAVDAILSQLEVSQAKKESKLRRFKKKIRYFKQYFSQNITAAKEFLEDTCNDKFFELMDIASIEAINNLDEKSYNMDNIKCSIATEASAKFDEEKKKEDEEKQRKLNYIKSNYKVTLQIYNICSDKNMDEDPLCQMVEKIVTDRKKTENKNRLEFKKYRNYYAEHVLAAKKDVAKCDKEENIEANILNFKCKAAEEAVEANESRKYDFEKQEYYFNLFKEDPKEAKFTMDVECKEIISDSWYFIDKNLQDEKCNAAIQFFNETL